MAEERWCQASTATLASHQPSTLNTSQHSVGVRPPRRPVITSLASNSTPPVPALVTAGDVNRCEQIFRYLEENDEIVMCSAVHNAQCSSECRSAGVQECTGGLVSLDEL